MEISAGALVLLLVLALGWGALLGDAMRWIRNRVIDRPHPNGDAWIELHDRGDGFYETRVCGNNKKARETANGIVAFKVGWQRALEIECERSEVRDVH